MTFLLSAQRDEWPERASEHWAAYQTYLAQRKDTFPPGAYALAAGSEWYFDPTDHRCPHDAWLHSAALEESAGGSRGEIRSLTLRVTLLGAYHDLWIDLVYPRVARYIFDMGDSTNGHRDWRYDEFRLSDAGRLVHEIEWWSMTETGRWIIEADDIQLTTRPRSAA